MNCDPQALIAASREFCCIPNGMQRAVIISLLCEWANHTTPPPVVGIHWSPETEFVAWTDSGGLQAGDYAAFLANVDIATLTKLDFTGSAITSLTGLDSVATLTDVFAPGNLLSILDVTGCVNLHVLSISNNLLLTSITGLPTCTNLQQLTCDNCDITGNLDCSGLTNLTTIVCGNNPNLTTLTVTGCTGLVTLDVNATGITPSIVGLASCQATLQSLSINSSPIVSINLTGFAALTTFNCLDNPSLQTIILDGCVGLAGVQSFTNNAAQFGAIKTLNLNNCSGLTNSDCDVNTLLDTLVLSGCTAMLTFDCNSCKLATIDLTGLSSMQQFVCHTQPTLTTLSLTNCSGLTDLEAASCALTGIDIGDSPLLVNILLSSNALTSTDVDNMLDDLVAFAQPAGYIEVNNQTPAAPPTPAKKTALEALWGVGNVITD